ncbi:uncharacterized protein LTR77_006660 [Saxophila tyrrhenica]|uniref:Xylanolytic transcriptional activator regulatory domain-containing protein n=1 Tax=Saxophila tyrrhenica TaxID=1690608 RepID=A0AAV9P5J8_9PEZI|nr:hypothetical protein LTR77_006660 [Saxophila tyrrhenica]
MSAAPPYEPLKRTSEHVPHSLYQDLSRDISLSNAESRAGLYTPNMLMNLQRLGQKPGSFSETNPMTNRLLTPTSPSSSLPAYIKPVPSRLGQDEIMFLERKGALTIPPTPLRDALLKEYAEFVNPYMPLLNFHELIDIIDQNDGSDTVSLLLFQAIMFVSVATVDLRYLKAAGYSSRRDARREFFQKTRLLYDFDYEVDRISLIQSLLLMTYWYETPDDQKDSHHWMGIAVSLSHTIGLHRNPEKTSSMDLPRQRLWRRMWWATYMRDRLIALGMRRPTRIKNKDFDVPMLTMDDFEIHELSDRPSCIPAECKVMRNAEMQRQLAVMCIEKTKLCVAMSHILSVQYSVLHNNHGVLSEEGSTRTTMMLVAKKLEPGMEEVQECDKELQKWKDGLAEEAQYVVPTWKDVDAGNESIVLNRSLLHMIYYATLSALHRPQVLPSTALPQRNPPSEMVDVSRRAVRLAAAEITNVANTLYNLDMVPNLPTTGITVLLPAIIIHLLDIKANDAVTRRASLKGFCECMQIMAKLRDIYAAADYSTAFLEAAIRKAEITLPHKSNELKDSQNVITSTQGLVEAGRRMHLVGSAPDSHALTPPPEDQKMLDPMEPLSDEEIERRLNSYLASTPPDSEHHHCDESVDLNMPMDDLQPEFEPDFDSMINLDAAGEVWSLEDDAYAAMQGESSGFTMDMDWMKGMGDGLTNAGLISV